MTLKLLKMIFGIGAAAVLVLSVPGCGIWNESPAGKEVFLTSPEGSLVPVQVGNKTGLFAVASWCHFSWQFIDTLNDPAMAPYLKEAKLVFALKDEVGVEDPVGEIAKSGGKALLYDKTLLETLPGDYYFITRNSREKSNLNPDAFPRWFSSKSNRFEKNVIRWFSDHLDVPPKLFFEIYTAHKRPPIKRS